MKSEKEIDKNNQKSILQKYKIKNPPEMKKEKTADLSSLFNQPPLIKGIEVIQGNDLTTKIKKSQNNKEDEEKNQNENDEDKDKEEISMENKIEQKEEEINDEEVPLTLPESEVIDPDIPLDEEKKPNINFCKNLVGNIYEQKKEEINIGIIDGIETGLNQVLSTVQDDIKDDKIKINNVKKNFNELTKNNIS